MGANIHECDIFTNFCFTFKEELSGRRRKIYARIQVQNVKILIGLLSYNERKEEKKLHGWPFISAHTLVLKEEIAGKAIKSEKVKGTKRPFNNYSFLSKKVLRWRVLSSNKQFTQ